MDGILTIVMIVLAVIQVVMIIKFFQISSDIRVIRYHASGIFPEKWINGIADWKKYIGDNKDAEKILLTEKFFCERKMRNASSGRKKELEKLISALDTRINRLNGNL